MYMPVFKTGVRKEADVRTSVSFLILKAMLQRNIKKT